MNNPQRGDVLTFSPSNTLVCPVNCEPGVMGAGLALQFSKEMPKLVAVQGLAVAAGKLAPGLPYHVPPNSVERYDHPDGAKQPAVLQSCPEHIILFPTKNQWRHPSEYVWVWDGLTWLRQWCVERVEAQDPPIINMPLLGCGLGGLNTDIITSMIQSWEWTLPREVTLNILRRR